jgi:transposase
MKADKYIEILEDSLMPVIDESEMELIFQHDNDPKHTAKITKSFMEDNDITLLEWPSCSPDLNPIENVWKILKERVHKRKPKTKDEFIRIIEDEWEKIDKNILKSLIRSMPTRIKEVIKNKGCAIMY